MSRRSSLMDATRQAVDAAASGDLTALEAALAARRAALDDASVSQRVAAFKEAEAIPPLLKGIKRRIGDQHRRLEQLKNGVARTKAPCAAKIDFRG